MKHNNFMLSIKNDTFVKIDRSQLHVKWFCDFSLEANCVFSMRCMRTRDVDVQTHFEELIMVIYDELLWTRQQ